MVSLINILFLIIIIRLILFGPPFQILGKDPSCDNLPSHAYPTMEQRFTNFHPLQL